MFIYLKFHGGAPNILTGLDKILMYVNMMNSRAISFKDEKNTEVLTTGHVKTRFTVVLAKSLTGKFFKSMLVIKGLKEST